MNSSIEYLVQIADKKRKLIIGLMSGTSLDGLDIALCEITGSGKDTRLKVTEFKTISYSEEVRSALKSIVSIEQVSLQKVCLMHSWLGDYHADLILETLRNWGIEPSEIDCIASHGQSIYHAPFTYHKQKNYPNATLQIIDGDHIARKTGILTISDFRQKHTAAGGEGAPMVALTDELFYADVRQSRLLLNIGGIANFTFLPAQNSQQKSITTDIGPGNTLIDQAMQQLFHWAFDDNGAVARRGTVHPKLFKKLCDDPFFARPLPRTTGPELFNLDWVQKQQNEAHILEISRDDMIATLTWLSAQTMADAIVKVCGDQSAEVYVSGGGMHNTQLMRWLKELLGQPVHSFEEIGFNPDAKEAACFAVLANEMLSGEAFTINPKQNVGRQVNFGKISLPV